MFLNRLNGYFCQKYPQEDNPVQDKLIIAQSSHAGPFDFYIRPVEVANAVIAIPLTRRALCPSREFRLLCERRAPRHITLYLDNLYA